MQDERSEIESEQARKIQEFELERERLSDVVEDLRRQLYVLRTRQTRVWNKCAQCAASGFNKARLVSTSSRKLLFKGGTERVKKYNCCVRAAQHSSKWKSPECAKFANLEGNHHLTYPSRTETIFSLMDFVSSSEEEDYITLEDVSAHSLVKRSRNRGGTWGNYTDVCYDESETSPGGNSTGDRSRISSLIQSI